MNMIYGDIYKTNIKVKRNEILKNACLKFALKNNVDFDSLIFEYGEKN